MEDVTTRWCPLPGAVGLLGGFLFGFRLRSANHVLGHLYGRLSGFLDHPERFGAGVVDAFDQLIRYVGGVLEDLPGQVFGLFDYTGALIVGVECRGVGSLVHLVVGVTRQVGAKLILEVVDAVGYGECIA